MIDDPTLQYLVARANAGGMLSKDPPVKRRTATKVERLLIKFDRLSKSAQERLLKRILPYKVMRCAFGWEITSPLGDVYLVTKDMKCSCADHIYRGHKCKHITLIEEQA